MHLRVAVLRLLDSEYHIALRLRKIGGLDAVKNMLQVTRKEHRIIRTTPRRHHALLYGRDAAVIVTGCDVMPPQNV